MKKLLVILGFCSVLLGVSFSALAQDVVDPAMVLATEATAAAEAAPAPSASKGDDAWLMTSTAFVILMSLPGLALFYGGLVRKKNMLSVLMQVSATFSLVTVPSVVDGYSISFT